MSNNGPYYPAGRYRGTVIQQGLSASKEKGTPCFVLRFTVDECLEPATPPINRYERTIWLYITDGTIPYFFEKLQRLGFYGQSFKQLDPETTGFHSFVGQEINLYCKHEDKDDGTQREEWDLDRFSGGNVELAPLPTNIVRDLDNKYGTQMRKMFGKSPQPLDAANKAVEESFEREMQADPLAESIDATIAKGRAASGKAEYDTNSIPF